MIRILTYEEHPSGQAIFDRYLYLAAYVLPFSPEDVLQDDIVDIDGQKIFAGNFHAKSGKSPRRRNDRYKNLLKKYKVNGATSTVQQRFMEDQLLAAKLIWHINCDLYAYLYQVDNRGIEPLTVPPMHRQNLRKLLTGKMDVLENIFNDIGKIKDKDSKILQDDVFRYDSFSQSGHAVKLLASMDVNVCPYCNRLYTMTITKDGGKSRPQFDHYKNKSEYPYLAVSLMNLIPSCGLCNQSKQDKDTEVLYPYADEMGLDAVFCTKPETGLHYLTGNRNAIEEFSVALDIVNGNLSQKLEQKILHSDDVFNLTELYNKHKEYILYLFWKNYIFTDEYLQELCREFPEAFQSLEDAKSMMYLMDIAHEHWGKRSLGKLTHDIDMEINGA